MSQVREAEQAAMASLTWQRLCQQKKKLSVELDFHQSVRPLRGEDRCGAAGSWEGAGGGSLFPSPCPLFPYLYVSWPDRFVLSKLSVPRHLCGSRRLAQRCWVTSGHVPTSIPDPQGSGCLLIRAWMEEGPYLGRGWAREMGGRQAGPGLGGSDVESMRCSGS